MVTDASWTKEEASWLWKKVYKFFLRNGKIWRHPKKRNGTRLRVVAWIEDQSVLMTEFHKGPWSRHQGTWATFKKLKERYWW